MKSDPVKPGPGNSPSTPGSGSGEPILNVADSIQSKGHAENAADGIVIFDGPPGDGRRGAKGLLLKRPESDSGASTWQVDYKRGGTARGLQLMHPRGTGHAVIHINSWGVGLSTPGDWKSISYGGGKGDNIERQEAAGAVFPLQNERWYKVFSRMEVGGRFEVYIDGKLVAIGNAGSASPLMLSSPDPKRGVFKGDGLENEWKKNWAGLILGPLDKGVNRCNNIRYSPGLADPPNPE